MSKKISFFIFFNFIIVNIASTIILPFKFIPKSENNCGDSATSYFEKNIENTVYTSIKLNNQNIDFHLSMERYPMYITDNIYKTINNQKEGPKKKDTIKLYSLEQIGINRASLINKTIIVKSNISTENEIKEMNIFYARKFMNLK